MIALLDIGTSYAINKKCIVKLKPSTKHIIIGHSHPECAYNDSLIPQFQNIASSGECYFYNYQKLKKVLAQNPSIESVWIEYTNNTINEEMNDWVYGDKFILENYPKYSAYLNINEKLFLLSHNPKGFCNVFSVSLKTKINNLCNQQFDMSKNGGYNALHHSKADSLIASTQSLPIIEPNGDEKLSEKNLAYLSLMINLCNTTHKKIILIRSPQHSHYQGYNNELVFQHILNTRLKNITFIDFSKFPLQANQYADLEHLNSDGATKFSNWFQQLIAQHIVSKPNIQAFVDEEIKQLTLKN